MPSYLAPSVPLLSNISFTSTLLIALILILILSLLRWSSVFCIHMALSSFSKVWLSSKFEQWLRLDGLLTEPAVVLLYLLDINSACWRKNETLPCAAIFNLLLLTTDVGICTFVIFECHIYPSTNIIQVIVSDWARWGETVAEWVKCWIPRTLRSQFKSVYRPSVLLLNYLRLSLNCCYLGVVVRSRSHVLHFICSKYGI